MTFKERIHIRHQLNNTEKPISDHRLPIGSFHAQMQAVYQFHSCHFHGHRCALTQGKEFNKKCKRPIAELWEETKTSTVYIRKTAYMAVKM